MKVFYNINVQMTTTEVDNTVLESAAHHLGFLKKDVETDTYCFNAFYAGEITPVHMRERVRQFLSENTNVYYVDVMYRYEYAMVPDRFVTWQDGSHHEYTGHIEFREDI